MTGNDVKNKSFLGALTGAIKALCMLLIDLISVGSEGTAMLSVSVQAARSKHAKETAVQLSEFEANFAKQSAAQSTQADAVIDAWLASNPKQKDSYEKNLARVNKAIAEAEASIVRSRQQ